MDIQYLNGIDIQFLNGDEMQHSLDARQLAALVRINKSAQRNSNARRAALVNMTRGLSNDVARKAEMVASGHDFSGFEGTGSIADQERLRNYLVHTKEVADAAPAIVAGYSNPTQLSQSIGYVLKHWDTPQREEALDIMIESEEQRKAVGAIDYNIADDANERTNEDYYDVDVYVHSFDGTKRKNGMFSSLKKALKPTLTSEAQDIVAYNPATRNRKRLMRSRTATVRTGNANDTEKAVSGLYGAKDDIDILIDGTDLEYAVNGEMPMTCLKRYLARTKRVAEMYPGEFDSAEAAKQTAACVDMLLRVWDNERLRNRVFDRIERTEGLDGFLKKAAKKLKSAAKTVAKATATAAKKTAQATATVAKKTAQAVAKVAKKVGKSIAKVAKKVWKVVVRFNPLTLLIRAGILGFVRLNMFKVANKCYIGSLDKDEALKRGATEEEWELSNKAWKELSGKYENLGGKVSKLRSTVAKGNTKKWTGTEYPTDGSAIKAAAKAVSADDNKIAQADMDYDETMKEYAAKGYVSDSTVSSDTATVSKREEVTIIENERTAKEDVKLYEGDDKARVLVTIPKAAKVLVDVAQTSNGLIAATYGNTNGWIEQSMLAGLGECDAESVALIGLGGILDESGMRGLGEPATATAIASATGVIATIMSKIKNIFETGKKIVDKAKNVIDKGKSAVNTVKNVVNNGKNAVQSIKSGNVSDAISNVKNITATVANPTATATNTTSNAASNLVNRLRETIKETTKTVTPNTVVDNAQKIVEKIVVDNTNNANKADESKTDTTTTTTTTTEEKGGTSSEPKRSNVVKIVAIGGGILALGIVGYMLIRKK